MCILLIQYIFTNKQTIENAVVYTHNRWYVLLRDIISTYDQSQFPITVEYSFFDFEPQSFTMARHHRVPSRCYTVQAVVLLRETPPEL